MTKIPSSFEGVSKERMKNFIDLLWSMLRSMQEDPPPEIGAEDMYVLLRDIALKYPGKERDEDWIVLVGLCAQSLYKAVASGEIDIDALLATTATA